MSRFCIIPSRVLDDERFSLTHIRVIAALGQHADKNGWCWPATTTLAERIKVSRQRISTCIRELKEWGYIEVTSRVRPADGGQTSNLYRVMFDIGAPVDAVTHAATLQPYVAPQQPYVAPPATSGSCTPPQPLEVAPPATSGGCTMNAPCVTTHQNGPVEVFTPVAVAPVAGPVFPPIDDIVVEQATPAPVGTVAVAEATEVVEHTPIAKPKATKPAGDKTAVAAVACPSDVDAAVFADFLAIRKVKRAPLTATALGGIRREADKAGVTLEEALTVCCERGWVGFRADWHRESALTNGRPAGNPNPNKQEALEARNRAVAAQWVADMQAKMNAQGGVL